MLSDAVDIFSCDSSSVSFPDGVRPLFTDEATRSALERAAALLRHDKLVAFPTETVYGLGASALSNEAVSRIYAAKRRPSDNPLIVHVSSREMLSTLLSTSNGLSPSLPRAYEALMRQLWPGPLSLLFEAPSNPQRPLARKATAGLPTFVARIPDNPIARALIALAELPIAAPSANTSGRPSPTMASHVADDMMAAHCDEQGWVPLCILDGGPCGVGVESTVVDGVSLAGRLRVLRLGGVSQEAIRAALVSEGVEVEVELAEGFGEKEAPRTPGAKYRHYAPRCRVVLIEVVDKAEVTFERYLASREEEGGLDGWLHPEPTRLHWPATNKPWMASLGSTAAEHARLLFARLRQAEEAGVATIFVELPREAWRSGLGLTVAERLSKAAKGDAAVTDVVKVKP